jgi:predicted ATPase/class 3 adenylate cyclase
LRQRLTAILAADVAGYTRLMAADAGATVAALEQARALFREQIAAHGGRVVDMAGDSVLALFESAAGAVEAALAVQKALEATSQATAAERRLRVRIGVHLGDVIEKSDGTIYGHGVNVAARLQAKAVPGGLCMSETLYESVKDKLAGSARFAGRQRFKNIDEPISIWQIVPEGAAAAAHHELDVMPNNLPLQLTSFIGREGELAEVARLLGQSRLLTLVGVGGIGKSRLSLELAAQVMPQFADGAWLVELATLRDARLVPQAVASVLGVKETAGRPLSEALLQHVKDRQLLLIIDNCEHLVQGCAELAAQVLRASRQAKLVASSREPLRVAGETTYAVPALPQTEAERLFVERARAAKPDFRMNGSAAAVAGVCRRLDGIPLAIELAAARVRTLPVEAIAARLDDRFRLLTGGDRTALPRQQTLRALIDWSYELLSEDERAVFRRLAVFAGGWTLEAAETVCSSGSVDQAAVLEPLSGLVDKSLVVLDADGTRYRLLDTVRHYALERLEESAAGEEARTRHLHYYFAVAEKARPELTGPRQGEWLARLDIERENLLAAHAWCERAPRGAELGLQLIYLLRPYWFNRGLLGLGKRLTLDALMRSGAQTRDLARCRALFVAGQFCYFRGEHEEAQRCLEESLAIARELGDKRRVVAALHPLGMAHLSRGDLATARRYLEEALAAAADLNEPRELAAASNQLGQLLRVEGDLDRAEALYHRMLKLSREHGDQETTAAGLLNLAMVAISRGRADDARRLLLDVLAIIDETGSKPAQQSLLEVCAGFAALRRQWIQSARFYGAAEAYSAQTGIRRDAGDAAFLEPLISAAQKALGAERFAGAEGAGRQLAYDEVIAEARVWLESPPAP